MDTRWRSRRMCAHLLLWEVQNCNTAEQPSTGECWILPKKDAPSPRSKEKPQGHGWRGETTFRIKRHTHQRCSEDSNKTLCALGTRDPTETEPDMLLSVWGSPVEALVSSGLTWGQGLWLQQPWACSVWHKPSWRTLPLAPSKSCQADNPLDYRTVTPKKFSHC